MAESGKSAPDPKKYQVYLNWAREYRGRGELHRSTTDYRNAIASAPDEYTPCHELSMMLFSYDNIDDAIAICKEFAARHPKSGPAWNDLGALYLDAGETRKAYESFTSALEFSPGDPQIQCNIATALMDQGNVRDATSQFQSVLKLSPSEVRAHYLLGIEFHEEGKFSENRQFETGQPLIVMRRTFFSADAQEQEWRSRIEDVKEKTLEISLPTKGWRTMLLRTGTKVILGFPGQDVFWGVVVGVLGRRYDNIPLAIVSNPMSFKRIQRRAHVRIPTPGVVKKVVVNGKSILVEGGKSDAAELSEVDISAAGIGLLTRLNIAPGTLINVELNLDKAVITTGARIVRKIPQDKKLFLIGAAFVDCDERMIDRIAMYVQRTQVIQRRKEMGKQ